MILSEKQALILLDLAKYTLCLAGTVAGYNEETRSRLVNEIINQQPDRLIEIGEFSCPEATLPKELDKID